MDELEQVAGGFSFAEGPRWHDGAIYLSHIHDDAIERVDVDGTVTRVADLPSSPISMSFASDGAILVSALSAGRIWRIADGEVSEFRDVSSLADDDFGDIVIDAHERIYLANQGMSYPSRIPETIDSPIFLLTPDGAAREVARGFNYANGLAITPDGASLIVAESFGHRLFALEIHDDGSLGSRRLIVQFEDAARPDGICCDAEGAVWTASDQPGSRPLHARRSDHAPGVDRARLGHWVHPRRRRRPRPLHHHGDDRPARGGAGRVRAHSGAREPTFRGRTTVSR